MDLAMYILFPVYGAIIGSFINVCIFRLPIGKTVVKGRSHCTSCGAAIKAYDLIPVLSWLILKGRCRFCGEKISIKYPAVELMTAVLFYVAATTHAFPSSIIMALFYATLTAVMFIDIEHCIIPDSLNITIAALAVLDFFVRGGSLWGYVVGSLILSVPLLIVAIITNGFGGGDVKLFAVAGLLLGWQKILLVGFLAFVFGGIISIYLVARKKASRKTALPFGPFICVAAFIATIWGDIIIRLYYNMLFI